MDLKVTCPKCNGCGKISPPRKRTFVPKSSNPNEKYCAKCKVFKSLDDYYKNKKGKAVGYCRICQCSKPQSMDKTQRKIYMCKHECTCKVCGINFLGYKKTQHSCSRRCHLIRLNGCILDKLSNELSSQFKDEFKIKN